MKLLKLFAPAGQALGFLPQLSFFTRKELEDGITNGGFAIAREFNPGKGKAVFIVAKKVG